MNKETLEYIKEYLKDTLETSSVTVRDKDEETLLVEAAGFVEFEINIKVLKSFNIEKGIWEVTQEDPEQEN